MADINGLPPDLQVQQAALDRKRQLAQMLLQQGMQQPQGQMVSGHFVAPNPLQRIAGLVQQYKGQQQLSDLDAAQQGISTQYNEGLKAGIEKYLTTRDGKPGQTMTDGQAADLLQNDNAPELAEPVKADPRRAMLEALTSGYGPLQQLGQSDIAAQQKQSISPLDYLKLDGFDPASRQAAAAGGGVAALRQALKEHVVDGQILAGTPTSGYVTVADARPTFGPVGQVGTGANGEPLLGQENLRTREVKFAPRGIQVKNTLINSGQKAGLEKWAELAGKTVSNLAEEARGSVRLLGQLNQLEAADKGGVFSGPVAGPATFIASLAKSAGIPVDEAKLANTSTFNATSIAAWQDLIKAAGGNRGVVAEEAARIAQMVPQLSQTPEGRAQLTAVLRQSAMRNINDAKKAQEEYANALNTGDVRGFTFGLGAAEIPNPLPLTAAPGGTRPSGAPAVQVQQQRRPAAPGTISLEDWLSQ